MYFHMQVYIKVLYFLYALNVCVLTEDSSSFFEIHWVSCICLEDIF